MTASPAPTPSSSQPTTFPARRTISVPSVAYSTGDSAPPRLDTLSAVTRSFHVTMVRIAAASESTAVVTHVAVSAAGAVAARAAATPPAAAARRDRVAGGPV